MAPPRYRWRGLVGRAHHVIYLASEVQWASYQAWHAIGVRKSLIALRPRSRRRITSITANDTACRVANCCATRN